MPFTSSLLSTTDNTAPKGEAASPGWERRPNSLVYAYRKPLISESVSRKSEPRIENSELKDWCEATVCRITWGRGSRCGVVFSVGHLGRCRWSIDWRGAQGLAYQRNNPRLVETVGAGT